MMQHDEEIKSLIVETGGSSSNIPSPSKLSRLSNVKGKGKGKCTHLWTSSNIKRVLILVLFIGIARNGNKLVSKHVSASNDNAISSKKSSDSSSSNSNSSSSATATTTSIPKLTCPSNIEPSKNDFDFEDETISTFYEKQQKEIKKEFLTLDDVEELKKKNYDGWSGNFYNIKRKKTKWKKKMFSSLKSGDSIFESACGRGFNLLMTVEILKEELGIENLNVYGIEYIESSVKVGNQVLETALEPIGSQIGSPLCRGDATNLFFIPDESFDLVFTGYIDPLEDPLNIQSKLKRELKLEDICNMTDPDDWAKAMLGELDQKAQEDWYAAWVSELVRIAKKGSPIIIEEVSNSLCSSPDDWGGVSQEWWRGAAEKYKWDIDVDSIYMEHVKLKENRYNLFMRKN